MGAAIFSREISLEITKGFIVLGLILGPVGLAFVGFTLSPFWLLVIPFQIWGSVASLAVLNHVLDALREAKRTTLRDVDRTARLQAQATARMSQSPVPAASKETSYTYKDLSSDDRFSPEAKVQRAQTILGGLSAEARALIGTESLDQLEGLAQSPIPEDESSE